MILPRQCQNEQRLWRMNNGMNNDEMSYQNILRTRNNRVAVWSLGGWRELCSVSLPNLWWDQHTTPRAVYAHGHAPHSPQSRGEAVIAHRE